MKTHHLITLSKHNKIIPQAAPCVCVCARARVCVCVCVTGRVHEVKVHKVINAQLLELQHHSAQIGAEDLRVCVVLHLVLVRFLCGGCGQCEGLLQHG